MTKSSPFLALLVAAASPAAAASIFDGTWKGDIKASQLSTKPSTSYILNGLYSCTTCVPQIRIPADGVFHPVAGSPYWDELQVSVVDPATVKRVSRKAGSTIGESIATVSADGRTLTTAFTDRNAPNGIPVTGTEISERVAAGPAGSHATSGSWRDTNAGQISDSGLGFTIKQTGKTVTYATMTGISYTAVVGGPAAPVTGDPGWTTVALKDGGPNTLIETDMDHGKTIDTYTMTVSPDGRTMTLKVDDIKYGRKSTLVATKQ